MAASLVIQLHLAAEARPSLGYCTKLSWRPSTLSQRERPLLTPHRLLSVVKAPDRVAASAEKRHALYPRDDDKGFVEEMRVVAMKRHRRDQAWEGEKEAKAGDKPLAKWEPSISGCLKFLVDSKAVHDTMESIIRETPHPMYVELRNTGLERGEALAKDLEWFKIHGHELPNLGEPGSSYAILLKDVVNDPPAFLCHFYNVYFGHTAGGRMIGKKISDSILGGMELEFYKWNGDPKESLSIVKEKINKITKNWTMEEKDRCLQETEKPFKYLENILHLLV